MLPDAKPRSVYTLAGLLLLPLWVVYRILHLVLFGWKLLLGHLGLRWYRREKCRVHMGGTVDPGWELVADVYRQLLESRIEKGSAFSVYHKDRKVVDLWGGYADITAYRYRDQDTTSLFYSATKAVVAIVMATLVDRGLLDYKERVCKYWPEFAQNGKEDITVEVLLSHQAGLIVIDEKHKLSLVRDDPKTLGNLLAKQRPYWPPGTDQGYHTLTFGLYADQLVRRVDPSHRSLSQYFKEELAQPYDLDFQIGETRDMYHRGCRETRLPVSWRYLVTAVIPTGCRFLINSVYTWLRVSDIYLAKLIGNPTDWRPRRLNDPAFRELPSPASHGFGTARACAKLMTVISQEGMLDGKRLLSRHLVQKLNTPLTSRHDLVVMRHITYGPGTLLHQKEEDGETYNICGHWGAGGQMLFADITHQLSWAYVTNFCNIIHGFATDHRYTALEDAMYKCARQLKKAT